MHYYLGIESKRQDFITVSRGVKYLLYITNCAIFQLIHDRNKLYYDNIIKMPALYQTNMLSLVFIAVAHWNNSL